MQKAERKNEKKIHWNENRSAKTVNKKQRAKIEKKNVQFVCVPPKPELLEGGLGMD